MTPWIFGGLTLGSVLVAALSSDLRRAILALWVAGFSVGGLYLTLGAELLGVVQWIVSTITAISLIFFSGMFGEYAVSSGSAADPRRERLKAILAVLAGAAVFGVVTAALLSRPVSPVDMGPAAQSDLMSLGKAFVENHLLAVEVLSLTLFLVILGGGVVARMEDRST